MKNLIIPSIFIAVLFLSFSCKDKSSNVQPKIQNDSNEFITDTVPLNVDCIILSFVNDTPKISSVYNSDSEYQELLNKYRSPVLSCMDYQLPYVNFNERTVLGYRIITWAKANWGRNVKKIDSLKKIIYYINDTIKYKEGLNPPLDQGRELTNFMSIPKIPLGYTVEFDTTFTRIDH